MKIFGKNAEDIFDEFSEGSTVNPTSIGQVHKAKINGQELAMKIEYPGVQEKYFQRFEIGETYRNEVFNIRKEGSESYFKKCRRINCMKKPITI